MINGDVIRKARQRAGLSQKELAEKVGVHMRSVGNWERGETVPRNREAKIRDVLAEWLPDEATPRAEVRSLKYYGPDTGLRGVSDVELLAEIARRFSARVVTDDEWSEQWNREIAAEEAEPSREAEVQYTLTSTNPFPKDTVLHRRFEMNRLQAQEALRLMKEASGMSAGRIPEPVDVLWTMEGGAFTMVNDESDRVERVWEMPRKTTDAPPVPEDAAAHDPGQPSQGDQRRGAQDSGYDIDQDRGV